MESAHSKRESVSLWHPWKDKPGQRHTLSLWNDFDFESIEQTVQVIGQGQYYAFCNNIFKDVSDSMLLHKNTEAYLSRTGGIAALRVRSKRTSGFIIPAIHWNEQGIPSKQSLSHVQRTFDLFGYEALTPSALSEKILRATLPNKCLISRPSVMIRKTFLDSPSSARIQNLPGYHTFKEGYENDKIKAYCSIAAQGVPTPFNAPLRFYKSDIWQDYPISWVKATFTAHGNGLQPIQIQENGIMREPKEGETFTKWLWSTSLEDCIQCGYTLEEVEQGWSYCMFSSFMEVWSDILFEKYFQEEEENVKSIIKKMMVGLPGRFLKSPEVLTLIHRSELTAGDIQDMRQCPSKKVLPIMAEWEPGESPISEWFMRVDSESDKARESAQLTPIGHYIVNECARQIFKDAKKEEENGNKIIRIYIDSFTTTKPATTIEVGTSKGQYKVKMYRKVRIRNGQFYGQLVESGEYILKAPGISKDDRKKLERNMVTWLDTS